MEIPICEPSQKPLFRHEEVARIAHEALRVYCEINGEPLMPHWEDAEQWQKDSTLHGVEVVASNPSIRPSVLHDEWLEHKRSTGWRFGTDKDAEKKTHPCMVEFHGLPVRQQAKDRLFVSVVQAMMVPFSAL